MTMQAVAFVAASVLGLAQAVPLKYARTSSSAPASAKADFGFDYLHLVQEWPGSFCDTKKGCLWPTNEPTKGFLLHGLWPEFFNGTWPEYCDPAAPFNMTALSDLEDDLHTYWPSLMSPDQASFWAHEWTRHGTCMEPFFTSSAAKEHDFFALTLKLREGFDAFAMLSSKGIGPASTTSWEAVKMALEGTYGHKVEVGCNFDKAGKRQLLEVRTCYQPVLGKIEAIDCPNEGSAVQCGSPTAPIVIPPFHPALYSK